MVHLELEQNESCVAELAKPPGVKTPMSWVALSERRTW